MSLQVTEICFYPTNDDRQSYTSQFNATSAATPIVAGAAALVQSYYRNKPEFQGYDFFLPPLAMRALLRNTGTPQGIDASAKPIGPLPNVENAINAQFPLIDIKPDGTNNEICITPSQSVRISYSLAPRDFAGSPADWWFVIHYENTLWFLDANGQFTTNIAPMRTDLLENTDVVFYNGPLSAGDYTICFAIDLNQDGSVNYLFGDYITIHVKNTCP